MKTNIVVVLVALASVYIYAPVRCARILGVFSIASRSHYILGNALLKGLAEAGHDVTMISPFEEKNPPKNGSYSNIVLTGFIEDFDKLRKDMDLFNSDNQSTLGGLSMLKTVIQISDATLDHPNVRTLLYSNEKFDVVIVEQFMNEALKVFAYHFNAPLILLDSHGPNPWVNNIVGNPAPPSYVPHSMTDLPINMTFFERGINLISYTAEYLMNHLYIIPKNRDIVKKYYPDAPDFYDIYYNASLILLNSHESYYQPVPLVPNMIEIGGFHVAPPKKLPKDLQEYLDNAKEGVVYFSMGSNLNSRDLPPERRDMFLRVFGKLKEKVLWKWEDDVLPGQPPNVKLGKWLPQQDILAHPNVKVFITHGGQLSSIETVYHGVPILAIPVFADQHSNARTAVNNGYALSLPYNDPNFSEERLSYLLHELLTNSKYRENVKRRSKLFHDRPLKPMENAIFWVEYIIRNGGAPHLRVAGAQMPIYKQLLLDVIAFMVAVALLVLYLLKLGVCYLVRRRKHSREQKVKTN